MRIGLWLPLMDAIYICIDWIMSWASILGFVHKHDLVAVSTYGYNCLLLDWIRQSTYCNQWWTFGIKYVGLHNQHVSIIVVI